GWWLLDASFAPDGQHVLYHLPSGHGSNTVWNLWTVPITGGHASIVQPNAGWGALRGTGVANLAYVTPVSPRTFHEAKLMLGSNGRRSDKPRLLATGSMVALQWSPDGSRIAYMQGGWVDVVDVSTGVVTQVVHGSNPEWFDDHTLILGG